MKRKTGIITDHRCLEHVTDPGHPETPLRLLEILRMLEKSDVRPGLVPLAARPAGRDDILRVHTADYFQHIAATAGRERVALTPDTMTSSGSFLAATAAVGGFMAAIAAVLEGRVDNAFALVRPPGHHAERSRALGYCLFNNVAIGAEFARAEFGLERILIVDWDVHHGNGTQHAFESDAGVFFFSMHQYPHFPGTGHFTETGRGRGEGYTMNVPLAKGFDDQDYLAVIAELLSPVAEAFRPQLILVSAGFDTHHRDPMSGMKMTGGGFAALTRSLLTIADRYCRGCLAMVLEGGYELATLGRSVDAVLDEMSDITRSDMTQGPSPNHARRVRYAVSRCRHVHGRYWKTLNAA